MPSDDRRRRSVPVALAAACALAVAALLSPLGWLSATCQVGSVACCAYVVVMIRTRRTRKAVGRSVDDNGQEVRPRFGTITDQDGKVYPLVFHPHPTDPMMFVGKFADDERPARLGPDAAMSVDVIGPGQSVMFEADLR
jgi:Ca2+/Na+ antiporter